MDPAFSITVYRGKRYYGIIAMANDSDGSALNVANRAYRSHIRTEPSAVLAAAFTCKTNAQDGSLATNQVSLELLGTVSDDLVAGTSYVADMEETPSGGSAEIIFAFTVVVEEPVTHD